MGLCIFVPSFTTSPNPTDLQPQDWKNGSRRSLLLVAAVGTVSLLVAYAGAFGLHRFADDWAFVYRASIGDPVGFIVEPFYQHWSPFWHATEILNFQLAGWMDDWFIRILVIATRILSFGVVWWIARRLNFGTLATAVAVGVIGLHHAQGVTIYSFDTYSQCVADTLGWIAIAAFWHSLDSPRPLSSRSYLLSMFLLVAAMLFKEQGLAATAVCVVVATVHFFEKGDWRGWIAQVMKTCWPVVVLVAAFTTARAGAGVFLGEGGRFGLSLTSVPVNMGQLFFALLTPIRTIDWFDAARAQPTDFTSLAAYGIVTLLLALLLLAGAVKQARRGEGFKRAFWLLAGAMVVSWYPVSIMGKVGELYAHTPLLWFALLVGFSTDGWWTSVRSGPQFRRGIVLACSVAYLVVLGYGLRANLAEVRATAERAETWLHRFDEALSEVPPGSGVLVFNDDPEGLPEEYSLYRAITPYLLNLVVRGRPSLGYVTDFKVDFFVVPPKLRDDPDLASRFPPGTPIYEMHVHDGSVTVRPG